MKGQWFGTYEGNIPGAIMVNVDEALDHYKIDAYIKPNTTELPSSEVNISTINKDANQENLVGEIKYFNPTNGIWSEWQDIKSYYPNVISHSSNANVNFKFDGDQLLVNATTDTDFTINTNLARRSVNAYSRIPSESMTWSDFKIYLSTLPKSQFLFRGQKESWSLRTLFHRCGRYRMSEFIQNDIKKLHQKLSAITTHLFDLSIPDQNGSFFNLVQHHGYPTPLLDWTYSPYVAAFFAFRDWSIGCDEDKCARIYKFDHEAWTGINPPILNIDPPEPHLSVTNFIAINNPRLVPQQSVTTVTNVDDIESFVQFWEDRTKIKFIEAIDIPANQRDEVMKDLRFMGITAGSMFPGIDGVCEELREQNFDS
ncbi:FRG domain-containing protein [uncultured Sneathiella sp.]|uniref:FRG domain-containing protein n=1 Tax=uncultured Sneathiella sp. TaxID=879315 RepID=UPI002591FB4C|nr:FRG domain-containing protein [uncultured Sneathiella sp.]